MYIISVITYHPTCWIKKEESRNGLNYFVGKESEHSIPTSYSSLPVTCHLLAYNYQYRQHLLEIMR